MNIERLNIRHIRMINKLNSKKISLFLLQILSKFSLSIPRQKLLTLNNIICLIAIQDNEIIGYILIKILNSRKTAISIEPPVLLKSLLKIPDYQIKFLLIQESIKLEKNKCLGIFIKCSIADYDILAISKELRFEKTKQFKTWTYPPNFLESNMTSDKIFSNGIKWEPITRTNAPSVLKILRNNFSPYVNRILDTQISDIIQMQGKDTGILSIADKELILLCLINLNFSLSAHDIHIMRSTIWDKTIDLYLNKIISKFYNVNQPTYIYSASEDNQLNKYLNDLSLQCQTESIILAKTGLKRIELKLSYRSEDNLSAVISKLNPNQRALPTP